VEEESIWGGDQILSPDLKCKKISKTEFLKEKSCLRTLRQLYKWQLSISL
jgi:hypothetical protein